MKVNIILLLVLLNVVVLYSQAIKGLEEIADFPQCEVKLIGTDESLYNILIKGIDSFPILVNIPVDSLFGKGQLFATLFPSTSIFRIPNYVFKLEQKAYVIIEIFNDDKSVHKILFREELQKGYYRVGKCKLNLGLIAIDRLFRKTKIQFALGDRKYLFKIFE